ncbi:hypothetical protein [Actinoplanes sp. RD1]|uniref:hypothetical protein n=1 Tax=Actinoplanes sp. RD1 TaxID=3064538 RepID=UPI0027411944|nr:hypothetical protein [Actinoplanes sp. RD1]
MSLIDYEPPAIEPDAEPVQIDTVSADLEYGSHTFGRQLTTFLGQLLHEQITPPVYRRNPSDRRACPYAMSYEFTAAGHRVRVVAFEDPRGLPAYAIWLGGERVDFELPRFGEYAWQVALGVWTAIRDRPPAHTTTCTADGAGSAAVRS